MGFATSWRRKMSSPDNDSKEQMAETLWEYLDGLASRWDYPAIIGAVEVWAEKTKQKFLLDKIERIYENK